jgi:hypothetical protein
MWQTISSGAIWKGEIKNKAKDGSKYFVESTIVPFMDNGKPFQYIAIRYESTKLKLNEEAILKQKLFYETIINNIPGNVAVFDINGNYMFIKYAGTFHFIYLLTFLILIIKYKLNGSAIIGSIFIFIGSCIICNFLGNLMHNPNLNCFDIVYIIFKKLRPDSAV